MQNIIYNFCSFDFEMKYDLDVFLWHSRNIYCVILCSCINTQDWKIGRSVWDYCENRPAMCLCGETVVTWSPARQRLRKDRIRSSSSLYFPSLSLSLSHSFSHTSLSPKLTDTSSQWARWISAALLEELWSLVWPHLYTFTHTDTNRVDGVISTCNETPHPKCLANNLTHLFFIIPS